MKKTLILVLTALIMMSCSKSHDDAEVETAQVKKFRFVVNGDFGTPTFTRGYLQADGKDMTDLWLLDYMDGALVQQLHQVASDADFGEPNLMLKYGSHHIYFVASRGVEPTLNEDSHIISWSSVRDTFWKDYEVNVVSTSNGNRAVTLDRVVTKLKISINDEVPSSLSSLSISPAKWFFGIDYMTGSAMSQQSKAIDIDVPSSYIGTTGQLSASIFSISDANEWYSNISITAKDASSNVIGSATITNAPFQRNRATEYSGNLFGCGSSLSVSLSDGWSTPTVGTW